MKELLFPLEKLKKSEFEAFRAKNIAIHQAGAEAVQHLSQRLDEAEKKIKELESIVKGHE